MNKYLKLALISIIGILLGFVIHGAVEIPVIFILTTSLKSLFLRFSWRTWTLIHLVFTVLVGVLAIAFVFWVYDRRGKL